MKKPILVAFIIVVLVFGITFGIKAKNSNYLSLNSISLLIETTFEEIQGFFIKNPQDKIEFNLALIEKRVTETNNFVLTDQDNKIDPHLSKISKYLEKIKENVKKERDKNNKIGNLVTDIDNKLKEITSSINNIEVKVPYSSGSRVLLQETSMKIKEAQKEILSLAFSEEGGEKGPSLTFFEEEYNFGTVKKGDKLEHIFEFTNTGDYTLLIKDVYASCGCTASVVDKKVIKPKEKGAIKITFDTTYKHNEQEQTITIVSNDYENENKYLKIKAYVKE